MTIESSYSFIDDLNASYPEANSNVNEGDDHIRGIKSAIKSTFPNVESAVDAIVQIVRTDDGAVATGTTTIPYDDTIPQNTEGVEYLTVTITPKATTNKLIIEAQVNLASTIAGDQMTAALFQDSTADALAANVVFSSGVNQHVQININHEMAAGTVAATTFKIRCGTEAAGTTTFNGASGSRYFGGKMNSYIKVTEVTG